MVMMRDMHLRPADMGINRVTVRHWKGWLAAIQGEQQSLSMKARLAAMKQGR